MQSDFRDKRDRQEPGIGEDEFGWVHPGGTIAQDRAPRQGAGFRANSMRAPFPQWVTGRSIVQERRCEPRFEAAEWGRPGLSRKAAATAGDFTCR
jgi:hypothetical protein